MVTPVNGNDIARRRGAGRGLVRKPGARQGRFPEAARGPDLHQDPLKPMDDTAFVSQLAQFSSLEQTMGTNTRLDALAAQSVGPKHHHRRPRRQERHRSRQRSRPWTARASVRRCTSRSPAKPRAWSEHHRLDGQTIRTMHLGASAPGLVKMTWDGRDDNWDQPDPGPYGVSSSPRRRRDSSRCQSRVDRHSDVNRFSEGLSEPSTGQRRHSAGVRSSSD